MSAIRPESGIVCANKQLILGMCAQDGALVSPIDLSLEGSKPLQLEPLRWVNFDIPPLKIKLTNSGDTMVLSAKWAKERPYLTGGPLDGNYVFSQAHFHWGSSEHEGSEHTVKGICYPMEMHVVFFKTRYLTQAAALKQDDGIIILAYLFRLQSRSCPGLHWLATQLEQVLEPQSSTQVSPMPLSSLLLPFDGDYVTYWGALVSHSCQHPIMWIVSRAALAVSSEVLNMFRCLLNSRKESMTKNFRVTSPPQGRAIFHINPSSDTNHLLLPGAKDPPCHAVIVNYSHTTSLLEMEAKKIFSKGDSNELQSKETHKNKKSKEEMLKGKTCLGPERIQRKSTIETGELTNNKRKSAITNSEIPGVERCSSTPIDKKTNIGPKLQRQCSGPKKQLNEDRGRKNSAGSREQSGDCVHLNASTAFIVAADESKKENKNYTDTRNETRENGEKSSQKSKLPLPKFKTSQGNSGLQSCYASYFKRPDSAPTVTPKAETTGKHTTPAPRAPASPGPKRPATPHLVKQATFVPNICTTLNLQKPTSPVLKLRTETPLSENTRRKMISTIPRPLPKTAVK